MASNDDRAAARGEPLSDTERTTLDAVLRLIIPASADGRLPSVADYDVWGHIGTAAPQHAEAIRGDLQRLDAAARSRLGSPFATATPAARETLAAELRAAEPGFLAELARQAVACYYLQDRVLEAIGMEPRAPFPRGHDVHPGDLSLLDPVRRRGKIYREVSG